jgi:hypothetical protein
MIKVIGGGPIPEPRMEVETDPDELARDSRFEGNRTWFRTCAQAIYAAPHGRCICIAGQQLFVADAPEEVLNLATAAHPEDDGRFLVYIPRDKLLRIYVMKYPRGDAASPVPLVV